MYDIGSKYSMMSDTFDFGSWYIDRTTGGFSYNSPSNASNDPQMQCYKLKQDELAVRLIDFASVQFSSVTAKFDAALALNSEKKSKLKF